MHLGQFDLNWRKRVYRYAEVTLNAEKCSGLTGSHTAQITSIGLGLNWFNVWNVQANAEVAFPIGNTLDQLDAS